MAASRSRQLLLDVYSAFLQADKAASFTASNALPALANQLADITGKAKEIFGADDAAKQEVESWLSKIDAGQQGDIESLDKQLESKTYLAGTTPTAADIALLGSLYPTVSASTPFEQYARPSISRYVSHLSHLYSTSDLKPWEPAYEGMPPLQRKDPVQEKKEKAKSKAEAGTGTGAPGPDKEAKKAAAKAQTTTDATGSADVVKASGEGTERQQQKKEKKEKAAEAVVGQEGKGKNKAAKAGGGGATAATKLAANSPANVDLRVGKIVDIQKHPDADSLYLEKVDFGEADGPRTVISGLVNFVPIEEMKDRWVVGVCNLKPMAMRGIKSYAMLLCATAKEGKEGGVEPVYPPEGSAVGDRVEVEGYEGQESGGGWVSKKTFEAIQPDYITTESKQAAWVGPLVGSEGEGAESKSRLLKTAKGVCYAANYAGATLS